MALVPLVGCVEIAGGSVEVPWGVFTKEGRAINDCACTHPRLVSVRLVLQSESTGARPCEGRPDCVFACDREIGATPFFISPGSYLMSIVPLDASGNPLPFEVPAAVSRPVRTGQPTELDAFAIVAPCAGARPAEEGPNCGGDATDRPCSAN